LTDIDPKIPDEELDSVVEDINAKLRTITLPDIATGYKAFLDTITGGMEVFPAHAGVILPKQSQNCCQ